MRNFTGHLITASECIAEISSCDVRENIDHIITKYIPKLNEVNHTG